MRIEKVCEFCKKNFKLRRPDQRGRFCSRVCQGKGQRRDQVDKYQNYLSELSEEQKMSYLKECYDKFVIRKENGCWDWSGSKTSGYGNFGHRGKIMKAHRASWILHNGEIPNNLWVLHKCDIRECSNPDHLFLGNNSDNMKDMVLKGRNKFRSKLTLENIAEIKRLLELEIPIARICKKYNVSNTTIWSIKHGKSWKFLNNQTIKDKK